MNKIISVVIGVSTMLVAVGNALAVSSVYTNKADFIAASKADPLSLNNFGDITVPQQMSPLLYKTKTIDPKIDIVDYRIGTGNVGSSPAGPIYDVWANFDSTGKFTGIGSLDSGGQCDVSIQIDMLSGRASAVGANFFSTDGASDVQPSSLLFTLSDGTRSSFTASSADSFFGFVSGSPSVFISQIKVLNPNFAANGYYPSVNHLYVVGTTVPEPAVVLTNLTVLLSAVVGAVCYRRRNSKSA
jgi:hypothetical protein